MADWKDLLAQADSETTLQRAHGAVGQKTTYKPGKGGFDPAKALTKSCDCSGFVAWAIGIPRELPPGSGHWMQTTSYWQGGGSAGSGLFERAQLGDAAAGDIVVYPDWGNHQGHMGLVSEVVDGLPTKVIHCSSGNYKRQGDAVAQTAADVFNKNPKTRVMKIDYAALRALFDIAQPDPENDPLPNQTVRLIDPILANNPTLKLVAAGLLELESSGGRVSGCEALHDALNALAATKPQYAVDLGANRKYRGYYGPKTATAVKNFQLDHQLAASGELDAATLQALDRALRDISHHDTTGTGDAIICRVERRGADCFARMDCGPQFFVGRRVSYEGRIGLANTRYADGGRYEPDDYREQYGHWAYMIHPTVICESRGLFKCLNTYDRARITFGFYQLAAHTPNDNFVLLLRELLKTPAAARYFPDLACADGRIVRQIEGANQKLEDDASTELLMQYFNPSGQDVEQVEIIQAAKLVHWCENDADHRGVQVRVAIDKLIKSMRSYSKCYGLDGALDMVCAAVADIRHQGRGRSVEIIEALDTDGDEDRAYRNLLEIGAAHFPGRVKTLDNRIEAMVQAGIMGQKRYSAQRAEFV
ncbi:MAG: peptidoglycan-binding protein [Candidatus Alcyoniella australis]|nr:peptidoglycan-binding protein [Candidatus Alcyoniella australis]